jgi:riboflavin kinase/FMN adenylyltransferase
MSEPGIDLVHGVEGLRPEDGPLFAVIGVFDGIHLGHRYLLTCLVDEAHHRVARPAVITFDSHPDEILVGAAPPLLLDPEDRVRMLGEAGVEVVVIQHFDAALRSTEYDEFVRRITSRTRLAGILMTPDAAFGHDRRGTPDAIRTLGEKDGFDLVVVPPFALDGRSVRSSEIREAIRSGDLQTADRLLGRPYAVVGETGPAGTLEFQMPVASPPAGSYGVIVDGKATTLNVGESGTMRLDASTTWPRGSRLNVEFAAGGETA